MFLNRGQWPSGNPNAGAHAVKDYDSTGERRDPCDRSLSFTASDHTAVLF